MRCVVCANADPADGWTVCGRCADRLSRQLAEIVTFTAYAADALTANPGTGGGGGELQIPISAEAFDAANCITSLPILESWERAWREHVGLSPYGPVSLIRTQRGATTPPLTLAGVVGFLRAQGALMCETDDWPIEEFAREVREIRAPLVRFNPEAPRPGLRVACPADNVDADGTACGWRLSITPGDDGVIVCKHCGTHWTARKLLLAGMSVPGQRVWAYPDTIADYTGVKPGTLRQWHKRGHVARLGGRYDVADVLRRMAS